MELKLVRRIFAARWVSLLCEEIYFVNTVACAVEYVGARQWRRRSLPRAADLWPKSRSM